MGFGLVVKVVEQVLLHGGAAFCGGSGGGGGVECVDLSALTTVDDLQAANRGEDVVLHLRLLLFLFFLFFFFFWGGGGVSNSIEVGSF